MSYFHFGHICPTALAALSVCCQVCQSSQGNQPSSDECRCAFPIALFLGGWLVSLPLHFFVDQEEFQQCSPRVPPFLWGTQSLRGPGYRRWIIRFLQLSFDSNHLNNLWPCNNSCRYSLCFLFKSSVLVLRSFAAFSSGHMDECMKWLTKRILGCGLKMSAFSAGGLCKHKKNHCGQIHNQLSWAEQRSGGLYESTLMALRVRVAATTLVVQTLYCRSASNPPTWKDCGYYRWNQDRISVKLGKLLAELGARSNFRAVDWYPSTYRSFCNLLGSSV